jgi:uncharacterized PurR-regulated membrane protein YhhQ (DUF165 family)
MGTQIMNRRIGYIAALAYIGTVIAANWAVQHYGIVPVGFGYMAPAGVYFVSLALVLRDYVQWSLGKRWMLAALAAGAAASFLVASPALAIASAAAFLFSDLADFALFTWIAPRWSRAVLVGGLVGAVIDSVIFLSIAFGSLAFIDGQILGKAYGIIAAAVIIAARRRRTVAA